jgi:hypothetical protein
MNAYTSGFRGSAPLKTYVQIIDSTRPGVPRSPLADARGYGSASSSPLVGQQAHGHSVEDAVYIAGSPVCWQAKAPAPLQTDVGQALSPANLIFHTASSSPLVGQQAHGHSLAVAAQSGRYLHSDANVLYLA